MYYRELNSTPSLRNPSLCLDYGADEQSGGVKLDVSERGMRFTSRWQFPIGTQLALSFSYEHPRLGPTRITLEGIVVWCARQSSAFGASDAEGAFETTLLFLELPEDQKENLREFSCQLNAS